MSKARRVLLVTAAVLLAAVAPAIGAKDKDKKAAPGGAKSVPAGKALNACGCYKNDQGACVCTDRKAKCECEGDCEPVGCDEKRQKEIEREYAEAVKRAEEEDKKRKAAEEAAERTAAEESPGAAQDKGQDKGDKSDKGDKPAAPESGAPTKPTKPKSKDAPKK
jgi:hypothetical protein